MRLFVAINLPAAEKARLYAAFARMRAAAAPVRWVAQDALHLTLKFLGDVGEPEADAIVSLLREVAPRHSRFTMELSGVGGFPTLRRPRVVWLGIAPSPPLIALQADVESALERLGFEREGRAYSPHLTLGRSEQGAHAHGFAGIDTLVHEVTYRASVGIDSVDLMRSHLSRGGARYERLVAAALSPADFERES